MHPCPSDASYLAFVLICGAFMAIGFTAIIVLAGEIVSRKTFEKGDDNDR